MRSASETDEIYDHGTRTRCPHGEIRNTNQTTGTIIAVRESGNTVLVHQPAGKTVSIGRSRKNDINLPDPCFPRKAAEIILGPVPLLRVMGDPGQTNHKIVSIAAGKAFKINPYSFYLLEPGGILVNLHYPFGCLYSIYPWHF